METRTFKQEVVFSEQMIPAQDEKEVTQIEWLIDRVLQNAFNFLLRKKWLKVRLSRMTRTLRQILLSLWRPPSLQVRLLIDFKNLKFENINSESESEENTRQEARKDYTDCVAELSIMCKSQWIYGKVEELNETIRCQKSIICSLKENVDETKLELAQKGKVFNSYQNKRV